MAKIKNDEWIPISKKQKIFMVRIGVRWFVLEAIGSLTSEYDMPILVSDDDGDEKEFIMTDVDEIERIHNNMGNLKN
tara:strand:- start:20488 stop:20718 length:231 start_codon:yes stop_codon:yes gene_type:complete